MSFWKHVASQPFVVIAGIAAMIHGTESLAFFFGNKPPVLPEGKDLLPYAWYGVELAYFILPPLFMSIGADIGQISTSIKIRSGQRTIATYATLLVFSLATYYLQWFHIARHLDALKLGLGVAPKYEHFSQGLLDAGLWIVPAILPLTTWLYTISTKDHHEGAAPRPQRWQFFTEVSQAAQARILYTLKPNLNSPALANPGRPQLMSSVEQPQDDEQPQEVEQPEAAQVFTMPHQANLFSLPKNGQKEINSGESGAPGVENP